METTICKCIAFRPRIGKPPTAKKEATAEACPEPSRRGAEKAEYVINQAHRLIFESHHSS